ncbi:MAG: glycosyltransferase family 4 protein [Gammaproteobacteria bacterium]
MTVVYDHQIFSWQQYGGISRYFFELSSRMAGLEGTRVEIASPLYVTTYFRPESKLPPAGWKIPQIAYSGRMLDLMNGMLNRLLVKPRTDVDIFHETYYSRLDNCPRSAKRIVTMHDMTHEKFPDYFLKRDDTRLLKAQAARRADHVICISESTKRDVIDFLNVPEDKISVIHHGGSLRAVPIRAGQSPHGSRPYLFFVGVRGRYKNFAGLLRAYAASPQLKAQFSIVCFGGGPFSEKERALIASLGIPAEHVTVRSGTDCDLAQGYSQAALFVFPSLYEGFGIPVLEAMTYGCPVACSNVSALPEVAGRAAQLFDPYDCDSMRSAIEGVVFSREKTRRLIDEGHLRVKNFSWEKCAFETLEVYKRVLKESRG